MSNICGIYKITSPCNRVYIGQSIEIKRRFRRYKNLYCKSQPKLYRSFLKYGVENHLFEIIIECNREYLNKYERDYQDLYDVTSNKGLNCILIKEGDRVITKRNHSEESRKKISDGNKGKKLSEEHKLKISLANKGRKHSEEHKLKMSNILKGRKHSEEHKLKIGIGNKGKKHTEEAKKMMSINKKGIIHSEETKKKMSDAHKGCTHMIGKKLSEESKKKGAISRSKIILDNQTGVYYIGILEAAKSLGLGIKLMGDYLRNEYTNKTNLRYV